MQTMSPICLSPSLGSAFSYMGLIPGLVLSLSLVWPPSAPGLHPPIHEQKESISLIIVPARILGVYLIGPEWVTCPSPGQLVWTAGWNGLTDQGGSYAYLWTDTGVDFNISWRLWEGERWFPKRNQGNGSWTGKTTKEYCNFLIIDSHNPKCDNLVRA